MAPRRAILSCDEPVGVDPGWVERYRAKVVTCEEAVGIVRPGQRIFLGTGCAQPIPLVLGLMGRSATLAGNEIVDLFTFGEAPYARREWGDILHLNTFFVASNVRELIQSGVGAYTPVALSDIPRLFASGQLVIDVALIQVSPPDQLGRCSLGVSVDIVAAAIRQATTVIAQVNARMPRTLGESFVPVTDLDWLVPIDHPLPEYPGEGKEPVVEAVARNIASLVEDGATLEVGVGPIPQETLNHLGTRRHLGIHSEMITDSVIAPWEAGVLDGSRKSLDRGRIVASCCMGSRRLYELVHNNPAFCFRPTEYVNDAAVIGQHHRLVAINAAFEVDLTGQVCAASNGGGIYSGIGGHADFNRIAVRTPGGKSIIGLASTDPTGKLSRIVVRLAPGAEVVSTRSDAHYVVTEHGVAYLHGKSVQERALSLIGLAHPDFRERLLQEAMDLHYIHPQLADVRGRDIYGHQEYHAVMDLGSVHILFRMIQPNDDQPVRDFFFSLSEQSLYNRFMIHVKRMTFQRIKDLIFIDHRQAVALIGVIPVAEHREEIIAFGGYFLESVRNRAEVALVVRDEWQGKKIGMFLFGKLVLLARRNGVSRFTATV
ncbi:MAG: 4-hydroxybutyrate CoA-transferase, partial [Magnetococcales bacterium]|nr:4-hydroxybutyrate CoA-transferase [Magnetococcales bacterium]